MKLKENFSQFGKYLSEKGTYLAGRRIIMLQNKMRAHHALYAFLGAVGLVLFWYGIWEGLNMLHLKTNGFLKFISHPLTAFFIGSTILSFTGLFVFELIGRDTTALKQVISNLGDELAKQQETDEKLEQEIKKEQNLNETLQEKVFENEFNLQVLEQKTEEGAVVDK